MTLCTQNPHAAASFAIDHGISVVGRDSLERWSEFDLVICGTKNSAFMINDLPSSCKTKLILDLSVPRLVNPALGRSPYLTLLNMAEVGKSVEKKRGQRYFEVRKVSGLIEDRVERQIEIFRTKGRPSCIIF